MAAAAVLSSALLALAPAASATSGTWGPDAVPYRNGVVCTGSSVDTALVSWTGADGGTAFGLAPIQSGYGRTDEPATSGVAVPVQPSPSGLDSATIAQLAYLVSEHGNDPSAGVVADVAADVLQLTDAQSADVDECLAQDAGGSAPSVADSLLAEAGRRAGPYSVSLSGPTTPVAPGKPIPLVARVTSAAGYPVPGLVVSFAPTGAGVRLSSAGVPTNADGEATVEARTSAAQSATGAAVTATVSAPVGLVETSSSGDVPLVEAAGSQQYGDRLDLAVDTTPDPKPTLTAAESLLLTNGQLAQTLTVTGMNGHHGSAGVTLYGPLALTDAGCGAHPASDWAAARAAHKIAEAPQVVVDGDGAYPVRDATTLSPGCYQAVARVQTTDASPNVSASTTGGVVTVAPVSLTAAPGHGGLAPAGGLQTTLQASSTFATGWQDVQGQVVGPRQPDASGACPTTGWDSSPSAASVVSTGAATDSSDQQTAGSSAAASSGSSAAGSSAAGSSAPGSSAAGDAASTQVAAVTVTSGAVASAGCYGFRLTGTLTVAGLGSTTVAVPPGVQSAPVHVITPAVSVNRLSGSGVDSGGHVTASVTVTQSEGQPGTLRLELLRLPYTFRGCFGADWQHAPVVGSTAAAPAMRTHGDSTYEVRTAAVPGSACWTVVPVFTAAANPAVRAQAAAGDDPMLAFTSTPRPGSDELTSAAAHVGSGAGREIGVGVGVFVATVAVLLATAVAARRGRRREPIDPRDSLLAG